jgi:hypothetical protein
MINLVITRNTPHPSGSTDTKIIAQLELPDDQEVVAIIMEAAATAIQEYLNKD